MLMLPWLLPGIFELRPCNSLKFFLFLDLSRALSKKPFPQYLPVSFIDHYPHGSGEV